MTRDRKRKLAVRAVQKSTGQRYTQAAKLVAPPEPRPAGWTFRLPDLLNECATFPAASPARGGPEPEVFHSRVLGAAVPYATVLQLAGVLADEAHPAELVLESLDPHERAVVVCSKRRFALDLNWSGVESLCQQPGCGDRPVDFQIVVCTEHLTQCDVHSLEAMTRESGYCVESEENPALLEGLPEADLLVRAAVGIGAYTKVVQAWLDTCFIPVDEIDDVLWTDEDRALAMRHSVERERLRLDRVARKEARRVRGETSACQTCGGQLLGWDMQAHPLYCSRACSPAHPPAPTFATPVPF
ncbi:hypothetical protein [Streptomyces hydrogenans]|uniref:hypothetical protein n=1 Tax=Streptomyces hydrogenans TaxID=1873719 RepID=UPI0036E4E082